MSSRRERIELLLALVWMSTWFVGVLWVLRAGFGGPLSFAERVPFTMTSLLVATVVGGMAAVAGWRGHKRTRLFRTIGNQRLQRGAWFFATLGIVLNLVFVWRAVSLYGSNAVAFYGYLREVLSLHGVSALECVGLGATTFYIGQGGAAWTRDTLGIAASKAGALVETLFALGAVVGFILGIHALSFYTTGSTLLSSPPPHPDLGSEPGFPVQRGRP